jgi:hypothetical protein
MYAWSLFSFTLCTRSRLPEEHPRLWMQDNEESGEMRVGWDEISLFHPFLLLPICHVNCNCLAHDTATEEKCASCPLIHPFLTTVDLALSSHCHPQLTRIAISSFAFVSYVAYRQLHFWDRILDRISPNREVQGPVEALRNPDLFNMMSKSWIRESWRGHACAARKRLRNSTKACLGPNTSRSTWLGVICR